MTLKVLSLRTNWVFMQSLWSAARKYREITPENQRKSEKPLKMKEITENVFFNERQRKNRSNQVLILIFWNLDFSLSPKDGPGLGS